ncbi:MAG: cysteine desulfurase family protein [Elusimicrobiota bacterium]
MKKIYFDHIAGGPVLKEAREAMLPYFTEKFGNPQSIHSWGNQTKDALEEARGQVSDLIGAKADRVYFTASGTESNNIAIKGIVKANKKKGNHIIISPIEHYSILHPVKTLEKEGFEVTQIGVDRYGRVDPGEIEKNLRDDTILVSVTTASSEIGTIQPVKEIAGILNEKGIIFHTDAVAAAGQIAIDVEESGVDALSLSAQSFYGPKGSAALYLRKGVRSLPIIEGGIQESGVRSGTENIPAIVGMGKAAEIGRNKMQERAEKLVPLRNRIIEELPQKTGNIYITGDRDNRLPGHVSFCVEYIEGEGMLLFLNTEGVAVSSGSACTSKALKASHVLLACGIDQALAQGSVVLSMGIDNTVEDVNHFLEVFPPIVEKLRQMSPLYNGK